MSLKAVIWGACGSLPCPATPASIERKVRRAVWAARNMDFKSENEVTAFLQSQPLSTRGTYKGNTACVEIRTGLGDEVILCDAGSGIRDYSQSLGPNPSPRTYHIFISHLHWDHIHGFPFFTPAFAEGNRIIFHGYHKEMEAAIRAQMDNPCFPVGFDSMRAMIAFDLRTDEAPLTIGDVRVSAIRQQHPGESWGYRFDRKGKSIVYSSDSEHGSDTIEEDYRFVDFFRGADVLILDGQYSLEETSNEKRNWGHSNQITAVELAARAGVKTLVIFHHDAANSDRELEDSLGKALQYRKVFNASLSLENEGELYPRSILLGYDGLTIEA